jgi:hypothetical protein
MAEFIGNAMPNGAHNFINIGHSAALGSLGGSATVFGLDNAYDTRIGERLIEVIAQRLAARP